MSRELLQSFLPIPAPTPLPAQTTDWQDWFIKEYLPFRKNRPHQDPEVQRIARAFGIEYIKRYAQSLSGSSDKEFLSFAKTQQLANPNGIVLLVVLDGLSYPDMMLLGEALLVADRKKRLTLGSSSIVFAPLPTITEVAKPALLTGSRPVIAATRERISQSFSSKDADTLESLQKAQHGEVVIWSLLDTDTVYHNAQSHEVGKYNAHGVLQAIAQRLMNLVDAVPNQLRLQVVVSTDHGRLLASSERLIQAPPEMRPHGRAALGTINRVFPKSGFLIEDDVVLLEAHRFGLSVDAAVVLSDASFRTADGKSGTEVQPHGGLYPEEVLIPYWIYLRDEKTLPLIAELIGAGEAGKLGKVELKIHNPNSIPMQLLRLEANLGYTFTKEMNNLCPPVSPSQLEFQLENFPTKKHIEQGKVYLLYALPSGDEIRIKINLALTSQELYEQDNILEGL